MDSQQLMITASDKTHLAASRWSAPGAPVVLLHAGVADRRSWAMVADELEGGSCPRWHTCPALSNRHSSRRSSATPRTAESGRQPDLPTFRSSTNTKNETP